MITAQRKRTVRDLIRNQLGDEVAITFTREMLDGFLVVYTKGLGAALEERAAFFAKGTIDNQLAVVCQWDNLCE